MVKKISLKKFDSRLTLFSVSIECRFFAGIAQLVEHNLAKVGVASSSLVSRSKFSKISVYEVFDTNLLAKVYRRDSKAVMHWIANPRRPVRLRLAPPYSKSIL